MDLVNLDMVDPLDLAALNLLVVNFMCLSPKDHMDFLIKDLMNLSIQDFIGLSITL